MRILTIASQEGGTGKTTLAAHLKRLRQQGIKLVIIDTPPQTLDTIKTANTAADFVLIPARPSPHDLRAVAAVVEMVEEEEKPFLFCYQWRNPAFNYCKTSGGSTRRAWKSSAGYSPSPG